ncbi:MAG TPA: NADPH:quinone reductase [Phycisphaerae bacterium]|jgi:NADPH2:quinone reductase|nr:NADPH:quinone reductase [Phycisphaerae bacterium]HOB72980.1 NADPH:quinone reductase [Phycisphaerae bacterium]HOJ52971.1 NADPH:quinone reductase [Phycisphaerae bacterium]HOL24708.1 NADPH:quinone reductase [Phycisphaerae bacterium]HPP19244.1 NADPH:quinone reductase [Phycisphaerae bacterium]
MKAIRVHEFGDPEVMRIEEMPDPQPGPGQVVVRLHAIGVNPVETYIRSGRYARTPSLPYTPGTDAAGVIEAVGEGVHGIEIGDRVYTAGSVTGTYAERALCERSQVFPLPERISFQQGAAIYIPYATAYRALFHRAAAQVGEIVLIHGASGGVGLAALQIARAAGMIVIATAGTEQGRELVRQQGADRVLDHKDPEHFQQVLDITGGRGVDIILEMLANVNLGRDLKILARGGRVVVIGNRGTVEIDPRDTMGRDASILGMTLMNASERDALNIHMALVAGLRNGTLNPVVGREIPLAEAARAHHEVIETSAYGKIVLIP